MASTEFMLQLFQRLIHEKKIAETSATAYIRALAILNNKQPFKNLSFLKKTANIMDLIQKYALNTKKTILGTVSSVLSMDKDKNTWKKPFEFYYAELGKLNGEIKAIPTEQKSEKQKENWVSWEEVKKARDGLDGLPLVVLSLYTMIAPRRNKDYLEMSVFKALKRDKIDELPKDKNYCIVDAKTSIPSVFIFNVYKTAKTYGTQHIYITGELQDIIAKYIKSRKVDKKEKLTPFLVDAEGKGLVSDNAITRILNKIFGKKVGSSMLRHIFLSDKYGGILEEQKTDANDMAHSLDLQRDYIKADAT